MTSCCACCCFYPKFRRKVDNIYPRNIDQPLIKNEVDKLTYYASVHTDKLSKIGDYLYQNLKWGLSGGLKYHNYVKNTIDAVEAILDKIKPESLSYYAPNFLKIVQKLLEQASSNLNSSSSLTPVSNSNTNTNGTLSSSYSNDSIEYQKIAASLFQKFCNKESSNLTLINYNLNFDQFVCQFCTMCYNNNKDERIKAELRSSGLQCLDTLSRRLSTDDNLRASCIWDNMDKIIPALLFIMHENYISKNANKKLVEEEEDFVLEQELAPYLYSDFYINTKKVMNRSSTNLESVKIEFRKASLNTNDDESKVMINLHENRVNYNNQSDVIDPDHEAKMLLKNISSKADYTTIGKIVAPILNFLDDNGPRGWELIKFVKSVFLILMYNVKQQHAIVIKELIKHLDSHRNSLTQLKCYIIKTIKLCIKISAMQSVGTAGQIIEIFTNLLKHLDLSVEKSSNLKTSLLNKNNFDMNKLNMELNEENKLQREIIDAMGQFTSDLPDYAKNDVFIFIARHINSPQYNYLDLVSPTQSSKNHNDQLNYQKRSKYFECLHEICNKYRPTQLFSAFTSGTFLEDILKLTLVNDWASRRKAHEVLHQLLDKYQILDKIRALKPSLFNETSSNGIVSVKQTRTTESNLSLYSKDQKLNSTSSLNKLKPTRNQTFLSQLDLNEEKYRTSKEDLQFMRKHGRIFLSHINENLFLSNNRRENFESIYITISLFLIGLFNEKEFLTDLIRFGFYIQDLALINFENKNFSFSQQCNIHKFVCAYFLILSKSSSIPELYQYCSEICDLRRKKDLFKFVFPEYVLLDSINFGSDSGLNSQSFSLTEIETEFKRDLSQSGKDYFKYINEICSLKQQEENDSNQNLSISKKSINSSILNVSRPKLARWFFDKNTIEDILKRSNLLSNISLFTFDSEFSLSIAYLQQSINSLQTVLNYRCPYTNSYESIDNFNQQQIDNQINEQQVNPSRHHRGYSGFGVSPSINQINQTPRRSIDVESNLDDDTSYDSTSQISIDQNGYEAELINEQFKKFFIDPANIDNQTTVNSLTMLRSQYQDITSFETIKRVLFNGTGSNINSNLSGVGASTIGPGSSIVQNGVLTPVQSPYVTTEDAKDEEKNMRIISEFKQKPFDELKQNLIKTNQDLINNEKYQQVFELINKELQISSNQTNSDNTAQEQTLNQLNINNNKVNLSASSISTTASNQSFYTSNKENNQINNNKNIPLNDIDFPQLFMY